MRSRFFPRYSEEDILKRVYSFMSRLHVIPDLDKMNSKDFFYHTDTIQQDIVEEEKAKKMQQAMKNARTSF